MPRTMVAFGRLMRDFKIQQAVYQTLLPELESAKLEQYKNIPSLQFVEKAMPAQRRSYPPRFIWTLVGFFITMITSMIGICLKHYVLIIQEKNPAQARLLFDVLKSIYSKFHTLK
jgi:uncharacterized protein involved in exopolysaccharide biosynthesis